MPLSTRQQFEDRFTTFACNVLTLTTRLPKHPTGRHLADQLLRSGTSVGAHMREARSAQSRADLIHKMQMALKEVREAHYWLSLIQNSKLVEMNTLSELVQEAYELTAILVASVNTAKKNAKAESLNNR